MPTGVRFVAIDWYVDTVAATLIPVVNTANARCGSPFHTFDSFYEQFTAVAREHPELVADALIENALNNHLLLRMRGGKVTSCAVAERPVGAAAYVDLPYDKLVVIRVVRHREAIATVVGDLLSDNPPNLETDALEVPTRYRGEPQLRDFVTILSAAIDQGGGRFIAQAGIDRFLVELSPGRGDVTRLEVLTEPVLVARLRALNFKTPAALPRPPNEECEVGLFWPAEMLTFLQQHSARADRSLSQILQVALKTTRERIAGSTREELRSSELAGGDKHKRTLFVPGAMLDGLSEQASRLDTSMSYVAQAAVRLARAEIEALPTVTPSR